MTPTARQTLGRRFLAGVSALAFAAGLALPQQALGASDGYRLGPQDKVRLKVHEWRAAKDEIFELEAFSDDFTVSASGTLSLPLVGSVPAEGLTPEALAATLADRLKVRLNLIERPDASAEVVTFRPFYIGGQVDKPGEYPFRPGLTVLQAVAIAGGLQRTTDPGILRLAREAISSRGELQVMVGELSGLMMRRARLEAEVAGAADFRIPPELAGRQNEPSISLMAQQERMLMKARAEAFRTQAQALDQLKAFLQKEVESLAAQVATEDAQIKLIQKELQSVTSLVDRGLAVSPRQLSLERTAAQIQGDRLRVETSVMRARQEISKADITMIELTNKRTNELLTELRTTQAKIEEVGRKTNTAEMLLRESEITAPQLLAERLKATMAPPSYVIVRKVNGAPTDIAATEATPVEPGDVVKVQLQRFDATAESGGAPAAGVSSLARPGAAGSPTLARN